MVKRKNTSGSIVVEASIILPLFLSFLIVLISLVQIALVEIALENAVSEVVKQTSAHFYPVDIIYNKLNHTKIGNQINKLTDTAKEARYHLIEAENFLSEYDYLFSEEVKMLLNIRPALESGASDVYDESLGKVFYPLVVHYMDDSIIHRENLFVTKVILPDLKQRQKAYFGIEIRYDLPLNIPFFSRVITFKKQAYERVWLGNSIYTGEGYEGPSGSGSDVTDSSEGDEGPNEENENRTASLLIDSINSPVQRGRAVRIMVKGPAKKSANITIYYKSGFVKDKECRFDSDGWTICDLKIGGHANEGVYEAVVESEGLIAKKSFEVMSKDNYKRYYH